MDKFNKGDLVLISKNIKTTPLLWLSDMDVFIGVEAIITDVTAKGNYKLDIDAGRFAWHPLWLTLITDKKSVTNFEYYEKEIKAINATDNMFALHNGKIVSCCGLSCNDCGFYVKQIPCYVQKTRWLYEEAKPKKEIILSEKERKLLEILFEKYKYIARDKSKTLYAYIDEPYKNGTCPAWRTKHLEDCFNLSRFDGVFGKLSFAFVEWEDDAAYKISDLLALPKEK